jgi:hypothetical protein
VGLITGLKNIRLPGDIPYEEWDSWHSLIVTDELSRVVGSGPFPVNLTDGEGVYGSLMGSRRR